MEFSQKRSEVKDGSPSRPRERLADFTREVRIAFDR
jgi:hypothetical protein